MSVGGCAWIRFWGQIVEVVGFKSIFRVVSMNIGRRPHVQIEIEIAAQTEIEDLTLVTSDRWFGANGTKVLWG